MHVNMRRVRRGQKKKKKKKEEEEQFRLDSNDFGFICAGESEVGGYTRNPW